MGKFRDLTGQVFGRPTVKERAGVHKRNALWICLCSCGEHPILTTGQLRSGRTQSCGCFRNDCSSIRCCGKNSPALKHGHKRGDGSSTYRSWESMKQRCLNPNHNRYEVYGGAGVKVCERWNLFKNFLADMGERLSNTTLGRVLDLGHYEQGNAFWMTPAEQGLAKRNKRALIKFAQA